MPVPNSTDGSAPFSTEQILSTEIQRRVVPASLKKGDSQNQKPNKDDPSQGSGTKADSKEGKPAFGLNFSDLVDRAKASPLLVTGLVLIIIIGLVLFRGGSHNREIAQANTNQGSSQTFSARPAEKFDIGGETSNPQKPNDSPGLPPPANPDQVGAGKGGGEYLGFPGGNANEPPQNPVLFQPMPSGAIPPQPGIPAVQPVSANGPPPEGLKQFDAELKGAHPTVYTAAYTYSRAAGRSRGSEGAKRLFPPNTELKAVISQKVFGVQNTTVAATLVEGYTAQTGEVLPRGTRVNGKVLAEFGGRIYIEFQSLELGGELVPIYAVVRDGKDGAEGVLARQKGDGPKLMKRILSVAAPMVPFVGDRLSAGLYSAGVSVNGSSSYGVYGSYGNFPNPGNQSGKQSEAMFFPGGPVKLLFLEPLESQPGTNQPTAKSPKVNPPAPQALITTAYPGQGIVSLPPPGQQILVNTQPNGVIYPPGTTVPPNGSNRPQTLPPTTGWPQQ